MQQTVLQLRTVFNWKGKKSRRKKWSSKYRKVCRKTVKGQQKEGEWKTEEKQRRNRFCDEGQPADLKQGSQASPTTPINWIPALKESRKHKQKKTTFYNVPYILQHRLHHVRRTVKKGQQFSRPQRCHEPNSPWPGIIKLFPARECLVSDSPARDWEMTKNFLQYTHTWGQAKTTITGNRYGVMDLTWSTQSGNCHFPAYIPLCHHDGKISPA
jgi:hypothetical protein